MASENGKALIQRFNDEVWGKGNLDVVYEVFAPDYVRHDLRPGNPLPGPEGQKNIAADFRAAFPDLRRQQMTTLKVTSRDGTTLSCRVEGKGSPLLLIHGAGNYSGRWNLIFPLFEQDFSIYALDRRGRGESGDASEYSLEREFEDAASVVDAIGGPVNVLGHSLGGICALEAALRTKNILRLILYEPPLPIDGPLTSRGTLDRLEALLKAGDREGVLTTMMLEVVRMPNKELDFLRSSPAWKERLAVAHTLPRELRAVDDYRFDAERFRNLNTPTLLLLGGHSPPVFKASIQALASTLRHNRTVVLEGQQHIAMDTAPKLFAQEVRSFLKEADEIR